MQLYRAAITFVLLSIVAFNTATATSPHRYKFELDQRELKFLIDVYHEHHGEYPVSDGKDTWFEKLSEHDRGVDTLRCSKSNDGKYLLGEHGFPIVFEPPSPSNGNQVVFRDVGENGIDDNGLLDDWDSRYGPQMGYWYKKRWPGVYYRACVLGALAVLGSIAIRRRAKSILAKLSFFSLWFGALFCLGLPWVGTRDRYGDFEFMIAVPTGLFLLLAGIAFLMIFLITQVRFEYRLAVDGTVPCRKCGYDLRGTIAANIDRCPECGEPVGDDRA